MRAKIAKAEVLVLIAESRERKLPGKLWYELFRKPDGELALQIYSTQAEPKPMDEKNFLVGSNSLPAQFLDWIVQQYDLQLK